MDQETLAYLIWQKDNQFANLWTEANLQNWYTDTQWLPRADYYRLGDSFFNNLFSYFTHTGLDYATTHTDIMVNNPNLFAFLPFDPISNTTGTFSAGTVLHQPRAGHAAQHRQRLPAGAVRAGPGRGLDATSSAADRWAIFRPGRWGESGAGPEFAPSSPRTRCTPGSRATSGTCTG